MGKGSSKPQGQIQENNNSPKKDEPINTVQEVKVEQKERVLTEVDKIFEKYGHHGIRTVLAKSDSKYQSLSYVKINDRCDELVKNIEDTGH